MLLIQSLEKSRVARVQACEVVKPFGQQNIVRNLSISVIVPHLNQPGELNRCLSALAEQTGDFDLVDIIVVDNGSAEVPRQLCARYPGVALLCEAERGPGPARNTGIEYANGNILAFIDSDCVPSPNWLAAITQRYRDHPDTEITGGPVRIELQHATDLSALEAYESIFAFRIQEYVKRQNFAGTGNMTVRRDVFVAVGPFSGIQVSEDVDWGQRAHRLGFHIDFDPEIVVSHPARTSFAALKQKWDRHIAHYMSALPNKRFPNLRTLVLACTLVFSPLAELPRIVTTQRIQGIRNRWLALKCLAHIRLYRARRMVAGLVKKDQNVSLSRWNQY